MENFYTSIKPFCDVARLFGLFAKSFEGPARKGIFRRTTCGIFLKIFSILIYLAVLFQIINFVANSGSSQILESKVWNWILLSGSFTIFIQIIHQNFYQEEFLELFQFFYECDVKLLNLNCRVNHKKEKILNFFIASSAFTLPLCGYLILVTFAAEFFHVDDNLVWNSLYAHFLIYKCFFFTQFTVTTRAVRERFKALNSYMM